MNERELVELAAKATGLNIDRRASFKTWHDATRLAILNAQGGHTLWNPRLDSDQAIWLQAMLYMLVRVDPDAVIVRCTDINRPVVSSVIEVREEFYLFDHAGAVAATRLAITRCAAEVGKLMK